VKWVELLHREGLPLALLSNMPPELSRYVTKSFQSLSTFEYLIYSCDYRSIKPELAIYRNCLELLKAAAQDILYLDDRAENVEAAARLVRKLTPYCLTRSKRLHQESKADSTSLSRVMGTSQESVGNNEGIQTGFEEVIQIGNGLPESSGVRRGCCPHDVAPL
jgi:FMN phosphatase YigB (HAD superfamily)